MSEVREVRSMDEAAALLDEWISSHRRLEQRLLKAEADCEYYRSLLRHLDPFLPASMQDSAARAADPKLYANIAQHLREHAVKRRSPFDEIEEAA